jgi:glyoxylase-like metal-dependent hydrolase (beta-lactamase superfamily II)
MSTTIQLQAFHGIEASVNAYLFSDTTSAILIDCFRNSEEALKLAETIHKQGKRLTHVLITHGHPDHYLGMNVLKNTFPEARIVVASQAIKDDINGFSAWMETVGWLEKEPAMKPKSADNPAGFDYENLIEVLPSASLTLAEGAILELKCDYPATECEHLTTIYNKDLNVFLTSDFCYNGVHPWLAVSNDNIASWKKQLADFKTTLEKINPAIYPGHGSKGDISVFTDAIKYIEDFESTVAGAGSRAVAMEKMQSLYPHYQQADFLLFHSINAFINA